MQSIGYMEMVQQLVNGEFAKRLSGGEKWQNSYLALLPKMDFIWIITINGDDSKVGNYVASKADILADDWVVI